MLIFSVDSSARAVRPYHHHHYMDVISSRYPPLFVGTQRVALDKDRMRLRVKPAKTQIVSCLEGSGVKNKRKLCKKVAISLTKSTTLFRKMD